MDKVGCERKDCEWVETEDADDCVFTTTSRTATPEEPGCCADDYANGNDKCMRPLIKLPLEERSELRLRVGSDDHAGAGLLLLQPVRGVRQALDAARLPTAELRRTTEASCLR